MDFDSEEHLRNSGHKEEFKREVNISNITNAMEAYRNTAAISLVNASILQKILESGDERDIRNWKARLCY